MDPTETANPVLPALEPARARFDVHKRSFATSRVILALALREMAATYGRSPGGYVWAILEPVGMILIFAIGFSLIARTPSLGNSFLLYYASGFLIFGLNRKLEQVVTGAISYSRNLLMYPAVTWLDAVIARFVLNALIGLLNMILILGGVLYYTDTATILNYPPMISAIALASFLGLGLGTLNCVLTGLFPVWAMVWRIAMRPLMLASGVLFIYEDLPKQAADILWWNPLLHVTGLFRTGIYPTYYPQYISEMYVLGISFVALAFGLLFLNAYHSQIINRD